MHGDLIEMMARINCIISGKESKESATRRWSFFPPLSSEDSGGPQSEETGVTFRCCNTAADSVFSVLWNHSDTVSRSACGSAGRQGRKGEASAGTGCCQLVYPGQVLLGVAVFSSSPRLEGLVLLEGPWLPAWHSVTVPQQHRKPNLVPGMFVLCRTSGKTDIDHVAKSQPFSANNPLFNF